MRKAQKGFTLVELIVVITILAILGTIAFISLQGYSQDAKNSKVASDLRTLTTAIETSNTQGDTNVKSILDDTLNTGVTAVGGTYGSGTVISGTAYTGSLIVDSDGSGNYGIGGVSFASIRQNGADFKDSSSTPRDYVYAYAASGPLAYYQVAGEITLGSGDTTVYVKGNYVQTDTDDVTGLVPGTINTTGLINEQVDTIAGTY